MAFLDEVLEGFWLPVVSFQRVFVVSVLGALPGVVGASRVLEQGLTLKSVRVSGVRVFA